MMDEAASQVRMTAESSSPDLKALEEKITALHREKNDAIAAQEDVYKRQVYQYIVDWGGAGATVPLTGFGYSLAKGVAKAVAEEGLLGVLTGGLTATSGGIAAAVVQKKDNRSARSGLLDSLPEIICIFRWKKMEFQ